MEYVFRHHVDDDVIYQPNRLDCVHSALEPIDKYFARDDGLDDDGPDDDGPDDDRLNDAGLNDDGLNDDRLNDDRLDDDGLNHDGLNHDGLDDDGLDDDRVFVHLGGQHAASRSEFEYRFHCDRAAAWGVSMGFPGER